MLRRALAEIGEFSDEEESSGKNWDKPRTCHKLCMLCPYCMFCDYFGSS